MMDEKMPLGRQDIVKPYTWSTASNLQLFGLTTLCIFTGTLLFYGFFYSPHQDLAGSALSGRLAVTLGESFGGYSIYFPPVEKFWFSLAAHLSELTGLRLDIVVVAMTNIMVLVGAGLGYRIRCATVGASPLFLILSVLFFVILPILFKNVFGLREHLVVLGLWPYLVLRLSNLDGEKVGWRLRTLLGLWMGTMLLFKYVYSLVVLLVELIDTLMKRHPLLLLRTENLIAGTIVFLYLFFWLGIDPAQREAIGAMRSAIDANLLERSESLSKLVANLMPAILLLVASWYFRVSKRLTAFALAIVTATVFAAWSQGRWYTHHLFPVTMAYFLWWWIAAQQFRWHVNIAVALVVILPVAAQFLSTQVYQQQTSELEQALEADGRSVTGERVAILTMHPSPYNQYLASHNALRWNPMMNNAYVSAELKPFDNKKMARTPPPVKLDNPGRRMLHDQMLRLWEDMPPDVLILDRTHRWPLRYIDVDWQQVFSEDPRFQAILENYRPVTTYDGKRIRFTYYVRID